MDYSGIIFTSLKIAGFATILSLLIALLCILIAYNMSEKVRLFFEFLITFPLVMPPTILGFYLLTLLGKQGPVGGILSRFGVDIIFTTKAAIIASTIACLPIMYKTIKNIVESISENIIGAAQLDGASDWQLLFFIRIPISKNAIISGSLLSFLRSIGEFGATLMVSGNIKGKTQTISMAIWENVMQGELSSAHLLTGLLLIISITVIIFSKVAEKNISISSIFNLINKYKKAKNTVTENMENLSNQIPAKVASAHVG